MKTAIRILGIITAGLLVGLAWMCSPLVGMNLSSTLLDDED